MFIHKYIFNFTKYCGVTVIRFWLVYIYKYLISFKLVENGRYIDSWENERVRLFYNEYCFAPLIPR